MIGRFGLALAVGIFGWAGSSSVTLAQDGVGLAHPASAYYRSAGRSRVVRGPQVRGFQRRRVGGYSFYAADTINTYGDVRTLFGGNNVYRDAQADRQTRFGPFDHGFFFDSGIGGRGGYSPYHN
jgi:hypothetical protein